MAVDPLGSSIGPENHFKPMFDYQGDNYRSAIQMFLNKILLIFQGCLTRKPARPMTCIKWLYQIILQTWVEHFNVSRVI